MLEVRSARTFLADAGVALAVLLVTLGMLSEGRYGVDSTGTIGLDALGIVLAVATALPLLLRRVAPFTVQLAVSAASLGLVGLTYALDFPFGAVVALYTVADRYGGDADRRRRYAALLATAVYLLATSAIYLERDRDPGTSLAGALIWTAGFAGAWVAGDRTRLRRERYAALEDRAIRTEREAERERQLAAAEERTRIARELHDSAAHAINVILVQAGAARLLYDRDPDGSRQAIGVIEQVAHDTIGEIDRMVRALRRDSGDDGPAALLPANPIALEELVQRQRADGLEVSLDVSGSREGVPRSVAWAAYRILQEALTNASRHGTGSASVVLRFQPAAVEATVTNPVGAGHRPAAGGGHGIIGMRERASLLGGTLSAGLTEAGDAFRVRARLPYHEDKAW
ncbi:sensor histidine kinase [Flindersiella endophytica]